MNNIPPCEKCGCKGNAECGHKPPQWALDKGIGCALTWCGSDGYLCPCCIDKARGTK
jgi:hypothetical protein